MPADVKDEIVAGMQDLLPEQPFAELDASIEEIEHWLNCHNVPATIPQWFDRIGEFAAAQ